MNEKILVVEDNPQNMRLIDMVLRTRGYNLLKATDGKEGLDMAVREQPDLIIMDVQLPKMDGLEVTRRLRSKPISSRVPIVAVTAYAMKGDQDKALDAGCDAYMSKPIDTRALPELVGELLQKRSEVVN